MFKKTFLVLIMPIFLFIGCSKSIDSPKENPGDNINKNETYLSVPPVTNTPLSFKDKNISYTKFLPYGSLIFFSDIGNNNSLSVIDDKLDFKFISPSQITDSFNYSIESLAIVGDDIFFSNISDNNSLYKLDYLKKNIIKVSDSSFYNISSSNNHIYFINKSTNSNLSLYDLEKNQISSITNDKCGKYIVNGDFILYENLSDSSALYTIKTDGSQRTKITTDPVDSFVPYNNSILYISRLDNNLYNYNTLIKQTNRIYLLNGTDLKNYDNNFYYINLSNSNHLHVLSFNEETSEVQTSELTSDMVNEYYPTSKGIFYKKPIDVNKSYFIPYK